MQWLSAEKELYLFLKCSYFPLLMKMTPTKYIRIYHSIKRRKNAKKLSLFTPVKAIKGESLK